ncbi:transporter [Xanthomarina sp. F2636L]|uniref:transporter n=1 Tax=Xanthomarina sp. F2636L TaxID=2996018 RepID=UPI00225DFA29|nr:transporter [Xanthomarina sp. F2636L]MCX7551877.1 transporter [Xanthomarina sp. F2636L]
MLKLKQCNIIFNSLVKVTCLICMLVQCKSYAQDIEPRRWSSMPLGTNVIGAGFSHVFGNIEFDPVLQAEDASVTVNSLAFQYVRPFKIGNKQARIDVLLPVSSAKWEGLLNGEARSISRTGLADPRLRLSINFIGPKAMTIKEMQEFMKDNPTYTTVGASVAISFPFGQYYGDKLLNLGSNTFVFRPQIGMTHNWSSWSYELSTSVFIYTNNNDFYIDQTKKQKPLFAIQTHLTKQFKHRIWTTLSFGYGLGGNSIVNRQHKDDERGNFLGGLSAGMPIFKKQAIKIAYGTTLTLKDIGANTNGFILGWSTMF